MIINTSQLDLTDKGFIPAPQLRNNAAATAHGVVVDGTLTVVDMGMHQQTYAVPAEASDAIAWYIINTDVAVALSTSTITVYKLADAAMTELAKFELTGMLNVYASCLDFSIMTDSGFVVIMHQYWIDKGIGPVPYCDFQTRVDLGNGYKLLVDKKVTGLQVLAVFKQLFTTNHESTFTVDETASTCTCEGKDVLALYGSRLINTYSDPTASYESEFYIVTEGDDMAATIKAAHVRYATCRMASDIWLTATAQGMYVHADDQPMMPLGTAVLVQHARQITTTARWTLCGATENLNNTTDWHATAWIVTPKNVMPLVVNTQQHNRQLIDCVFACEDDGLGLHMVMTLQDDSNYVYDAAVTENGVLTYRVIHHVISDKFKPFTQAYVDVDHKRSVFLVRDNLAKFMSNGTWSTASVNGMHVEVNDKVFKVLDANNNVVLVGHEDMVNKNGTSVGITWRMVTRGFENEESFYTNIPAAMNSPMLTHTGSGQALCVAVDENNKLAAINEDGLTVVYPQALANAATVAWTVPVDDNTALIGLTTGQMFKITADLQVQELTGEQVDNVFAAADELFAVMGNQILLMEVGKKRVDICHDVAYSKPDGELFAIRRNEDGLYAFTKVNNVPYLIKLQAE